MPDLRALNPQQRLAVETLDGPVLVLAGAGTGKTRVITYRIAHLIEQGVPPWQILGVTFTNKAAREMLQRVNQLLPRRHKPASRAAAGCGQAAPDAWTDTARPTICTFHSLGARILRRHIERLGYKRNFSIYTESDQLGVVRKILSRFSARDAKGDPAAVLALLSRCRNSGWRTPGHLPASLAALLERVRQHYEAALRACNAVDFDDLLLLPLRLFREHPDVLAEYQRQYRYVMVDEYQDTNAVQFELVRHLVAVHRNLCVVGDDDQSIYGWRGADLTHLLEMERHFDRVKVIKLEQNYRSTNTILRAANALIRHNARRRPKQLWSQHGDGPKITLHTFADEEAEARGIVEEIEFRRLARRVPWHSQAVLFRTNGQSRALETALRQAGVRYHLVGGQSYFDRREVKDVLAWLKTLLNPHDDASLLRIANVPARGLSETTMERLLAASSRQGCSVFAVMCNPSVLDTFPSRARQSITEFVQLVERAHNSLLSPPAAAGSGVSLRDRADGFLQQIGYFDDLRRSEKDAETGEQRVRNARELLDGLDALTEPGTPTERLQAFLEAVSLDPEQKEEQTQPADAVTLITMHSCKGLEFPHVYVVGVEDGLIPHARSKDEGTLDEERRLFYVAVTRAMQQLDLSYCVGRKKYGQVMPCRPSPFLKELPGELIEDAASRAETPVSQETARDWFARMRAAVEELPAKR